MGKVIDFPGMKRDGIERVVDHFTANYKESGLTDAQIDIAVKGLEPILRWVLPRREFEFKLPGNLPFNQNQTESICAAHNRCMQEATDYYSERLWQSLCIIASLLGRDAQRGT